MIKALLDHRVSIRQMVYLAVFGSVPYGLIGAVWAMNHMSHVESLTGLDQLFSFLGELIAWPVLIIADVTLR
jgi:hypothetical protein